MLFSQRKLTELTSLVKKSYMKIYKNIILLISFLFCFTILRGQNISYKLYTPHDGLAQSQVTCLFQDSRGYIWVGTKAGISWFNGIKFQSLTPKDGLPSSQIGQIQEDLKGNIWFTCGSWFCKYDGENLTADTANIRPRDGVFFVDKSGTGWSLSRKDSLIYVSKDFKNWEHASSKDTVLKNHKMDGVYYDKKKDRLFLREQGNSWIYRAGQLQKIQSINFFDGKSDKGVEYGFRDDSIFEIQNDNFKFVKKVQDIFMQSGVCRSDDKIWFIQRFRDKLYSLNKNNEVDTFSLNCTAVITMFEDKDKNVWIGTEEGLMRVYPEGFKNFKKEDLGGVWSMVEDTKGGMWFGDYFSHKLRRYDGKKIVEKTINYALSPTLTKGDLSDFYFGGGRDKLGNLYFPSGSGIKKWNGKQMSLLAPSKNDGHDISMNFYLDTVRNIIVSGTRDGFNIYNLKDGKTKFYGREKGVYCVKTSHILGTTKDNEGRYWLSTGYGASVFDFEKDSVIKSYTPQKKNFSFFGIYSIFCDVKGTIWAGSSQGLLRYDVKGDTFTLIAKGIIKSAISSLKGYKDQYLVVGARDGVYFLDLKAFYTEGGKEIVRCFNQYNGYLGIEPNQNCLYVDSKDNVWVAASDIVTKITPSELDMVQKPLIPYITTINNERITYESYQQIISLPRGVNSAKIFFEAVGFERPFNTEFQYKLDNGNWSNWRVEDFEVLDNLSSGVYKFSVRTRPAGTANESDIRETYIRFRINIPLYRESYFPFLAFFLLMVLGFGAWYYIQKQKRRSELTETLHEIDIEQRKNVELLNVEMSHRVRNNLNIMGNIMSMQATRVKQEEAKKVLHESVDRIHAMALLHDHLISKKGVETLKMSQYMADLCENVKKSYSDYSKNLAFSIEIDDVELAQKFGRDIGLIVSELLTNSIKHAFAEQEFPHVIIQLHEKANLFLLTYRDNGCGLPPDFDIHKTTSLGLKLIYGIADKFKGTVKIENKEGLYCQIGFEKKN
jgi:two-component sensor histidine kinase